MLAFLLGFAYLGGLDLGLVLPRLAQPGQERDGRSFIMSTPAQTAPS
jgi:allophanate hydrolase subunit 1